MRLIACLVSLLAIGATAPERLPAPSAPTPSRLISPAPYCTTARTAQSDRPRIHRKLGELPPADAYQAVYRLGADGCIDPLLVSDRISNTRER